MMGLRLGKRAWRRAALVVGVGLPCALFWGMRVVGSWRPQVWFEGAKIYDVALSPTEPLLAMTVEEDEMQLQVWDTERQKLLWKQPIEPASRDLVFSPDGKMLKTKAIATTLWDAHTGKWLRNLRDAGVFDGKSQFSSDSQTLINVDTKLAFYDVGSGRRQRTVVLPRIYEAARMRPLSRAPKVGRYRYLAALTVTPDAKTLVATVETWDEKGNPVWPETDALSREQWLCDAQGHFQAPLPNSGLLETFSPDSRLMVSSKPPAIDDSHLQLWDMASRKRLRLLSAPHSQPGILLTHVRFSHDGTRLFALSTDSAAVDTVVIWEVASGRMVRSFPAGKNGSSLIDFDLSADDNVLVATNEAPTGDLKLYFWRVR